MKLSITAALLAAVAVPAKASVPIQTFYIPLPEHSLFYDVFEHINEDRAEPPIESMVSFAISTTGTIIWYDHWEDGYEDDVTNPSSSETQIWGDGNAANGCAPDLAERGIACTDANDILTAGHSIVIQNTVPLPRNEKDWSEGGILFDGGDKVSASYPIAITRGAYPNKPGSLMAGAVEVLDTDNWGQSFVCPVGPSVASVDNKYWKGVDSSEPFQYTGLYIMAKEDGTEVILPDGEVKYLKQGKGTMVRANQGDIVTSDKPIQVDLITGDLESNFELRWYSLIGTEVWSNDYVSPVGDSVGNTRMILYNHGTTDINVEVTWLEDGDKNNAKQKSSEVVVPSKGSAYTPVIPSSSGAFVKSADGDFIALSISDSEMVTGFGTTGKLEGKLQGTGGQWYDWGFPVVPRNMLTPQVLIGWGYGCTNNNCNGDVDRSVVWVTAVEDADIYIDFDNTGDQYTVQSVKQLEGIKITDPSDDDMSGAILFATEPGSGPEGQPVDIAAAWGQDPSVSYAKQWISLDLGTVVLPFTTIRVSKIASKQEVAAGETLRYTIRVMNVGQVNIPAGEYTIYDPDLNQMDYIPGTTTYSTDGGLTSTKVPDDTVGSAFPIDEQGLDSMFDLPRRGGVHEVSFEVKVNAETLYSKKLVNAGTVKQNNVLRQPPLPFEAITPVVFNPVVLLDNVVHSGRDGNGLTCNDGTELVTDVHGAPVNYCFTVTNTGTTHLKNPVVTNPVLDGFRQVETTILAPGESYTVQLPGIITGDVTNMAAVTAQPVFANGDPIPGLQPVTFQDPSGVDMIDFAPDIKIENTVYLGHEGGVGACGASGVEQVSGLASTPVTYCFKVENTGNTWLADVKVKNPILDGYNFIRDDGDTPFGPGDTFTVAYQGTIEDDLENIAYVQGNPVLANGNSIPNLDDVKDDDPSSVVKVEPPPSDTRSGDKKPYVPPTPDEPDTPTKCMQDHWEDDGKTQDLVCRAKEVYLEYLSSPRLTCKEGQTITTTIDANVHFNAARYDPTWFVATDGGDALVGTCVLKGLVQGKDYKVTDSKDSDDVVGHVAWNNDHKGGNDSCGDVFVAGGGANIACPLIVETEIKCTDDNNDGTLDISVCFSWRTKGTDGFCTLDNNDVDTTNDLADAYPGTPSKCFCARYDVPTITVVKPHDENKIC